jgi:hypothetical protein
VISLTSGFEFEPEIEQDAENVENIIIEGSTSDLFVMIRFSRFYHGICGFCTINA